VQIHKYSAHILETAYPFLTLSAQRTGTLQAALAGERTFCLHLPAIQTALPHCVACIKKEHLSTAYMATRYTLTSRAMLYKTHKVAQQRLWHDGLQKTLSLEYKKCSITVYWMVNISTTTDFESQLSK